jgi:hypothetical protein
MSHVVLAKQKRYSPGVAGHDLSAAFNSYGVVYAEVIEAKPEFPGSVNIGQELRVSQ